MLYIIVVYGKASPGCKINSKKVSLYDRKLNFYGKITDSMNHVALFTKLSKHGSNFLFIIGFIRKAEYITDFSAVHE